MYLHRACYLFLCKLQNELLFLRFLLEFFIQSKKWFSGDSRHCIGPLSSKSFFSESNYLLMARTKSQFAIIDLQHLKKKQMYIYLPQLDCLSVRSSFFSESNYLLMARTKSQFAIIDLQHLKKKQMYIYLPQLDCLSVRSRDHHNYVGPISNPGPFLDSST